MKKSCIQAMEYRVNMITNLLTDFVFNILKVFLVDIIFNNVTDIAGFSKYQVMYIFGLSFVVLSLYMMFVFFNHIQLPLKIQSGDLDMCLIKPIGLEFELSFRSFNIGGIGSAVFGFYIMFVSAKELDLAYDPRTVLLSVFLILLGFVVYYSLSKILYTIAFFTIKTNGFVNVIVDMGEIIKYPFQLFPKVIQFIFTFFIPLFLVASLPGEIICGTISYKYIFICVIFATVIFAIAKLFFHYALRKYSSAN